MGIGKQRWQTFKGLEKTPFLSHSQVLLHLSHLLSPLPNLQPSSYYCRFTQSHQWGHRWCRRLGSVCSYFFLLLCSLFPPLPLPSYCFLCSSVGFSMGHTPYKGTLAAVRAYPWAAVPSWKCLIQCGSSTGSSPFQKYLLCHELIHWPQSPQGSTWSSIGPPETTVPSGS